MVKRNLSQNYLLFKEAKRHLVGGVNSPVRSFFYAGGNPVLIARGKGAHVWDYDGNSYIDYVLSWGSLLLGHRYPQVVEVLRQQLGQGLGFGATNAGEIELALEIKQAIPFIEKIRFVNSGSEAVMGALRLARGYTARDKVLKFEHAYHGHADYLLAQAGSGLATLNIPSSSGVPRSFIAETLVAPANNQKALSKIFKRQGRSIAAVIVEPVGGNYGVIPPDIEFLRFLRKVTRRYGALLVFDEVITGFRFGFSSLAQFLGITPDIICLGKIIGGGLPIGAYAAKSEIMRLLAPEGKVYQASTFAGNPLVMQAGAATLRALSGSKKEYARIGELTQKLCLWLQREAANKDIELQINFYGSMFSLRFGNKGKFGRFYRSLLRQGIYLAPSEFEANFVSFAHTERDIHRTIVALRTALI